MSARRLGAGGIFSAFRTRRIVDALTRWPTLSSSPWILVPPAVVLGSEPLDEHGNLGADWRPSRPVRIDPLPGDQAAVIEALTLERNASHPRAVLQVLKEHCRDAKDEGMRIVS